MLLLGPGSAPAAESTVMPPNWAIAVQFPAKPETDEVRTPTEQGDVLAQRFFHEQGGLHLLLVRFTYPVALRPGEAAGVYVKSEGELLRSRPGEIRSREKYHLGPYDGVRLVIAQWREGSTREIRLVVIGSSLYVCSAEWPVTETGSGPAADFLGSIRLQPAYADARAVEERERWREQAAGKFRLRYDATRWYRDPADREPGIFNFLRTDLRAEAQFIVEDQPLEGGDIEAAVLATAREGAESVMLRKRGTKLRGDAQLVELEFAARVDRVTYINHGYFYSGPAGTMQLRGWAREADNPAMADNITELLDGLLVQTDK